MYKLQYFRWDFWKTIESIKDSGVTFDNKLKVDDNISNKITYFKIREDKRRYDWAL